MIMAQIPIFLAKLTRPCRVCTQLPPMSLPFPLTPDFSRDLFVLSPFSNRTLTHCLAQGNLPSTFIIVLKCHRWHFSFLKHFLLLLLLTQLLPGVSLSPLMLPHCLPWVDSVASNHLKVGSSSKLRAQPSLLVSDLFLGDCIHIYRTMTMYIQLTQKSASTH